ncbi:hypothetical protein DMH01_11075 [Amycolatopsis sp. WAC 04182]|uniref:Rv2732c family membrane protein n=1 Tax=Amycolatopsis sp. WAC 04182 TaxID=2203198 RepID=UPI000F772C59|nr:hypothetical protein [Amycolatopsis sp. WAC 04182]RSN63142.1 hypothetical protein DMH01_11075 [Amycolatopsis sp. WAC 04182]
MTEPKIDELAAEIDEVGERAAKTIELGRRGFSIAVLVFVLLVAQLLPWVGEYAGWEVLLGKGGGIPQLFAATSTGVGVFVSAVTLVTRRWWLAWVCAAGGWFASVDGMLAIWSQQSSNATGAAGGGPGFGLIVAWIATVALAVYWMRAAFSRS